ncbi:tRNA lysidine(34) synthetase TilS [Undibacterium oligocarboniphilum]|uniref:tRNA(Ile)-lysidine synthase n=1 Tax=Undibacterium oligocarboniphilum TaxID=666702 RepID=A0A850QJT2_9BURK|nr:tRNA lysidine(34) synthetase TilS [Undibacterium oligocarboniphilum]MBC3868703.1 tRNA lysidine(34) synthetase TilS [Undibacterium oligocarboniphilum]NVO76684.1 tRNA lysidine(34) synthetase TilS [Undibacterium oligocarboniphilum]
MKSDPYRSHLFQRFTKELDLYFDQLKVQSLQQGIAIAYSGGLDSTALLLLSKAYCQQRHIPLHAIHIHHGLSPNADAWLTHCQSMCNDYGIHFHSRKVNPENIATTGLEASAREARYRALGDVCDSLQIRHVMTAHHQDDQAETLLMQLLRGSGVAGMSGMDCFNFAPSLLGTPDLMLMRPLLAEIRESLEEWVRATGVSYISDESNSDTRFLRNALRHQVMPVLEKISPGFPKRIARTALHMRSARKLIDDLAEKDFQCCYTENVLLVPKLESLSVERANNVFRFWLARLDSKMPTTSRLNEIRKQLFEARCDAKITVYHDNLAFHRYQDRIYIVASISRAEKEEIPQFHFRWSGESSLDFDQFGGTLFFNKTDYGLEPDWLSQQMLTLHLRRGGEKLKLAENRPTRDIKNHYQSMKIPFWIREKLPFVSFGGGLLFAANVGMQSSYCHFSEGNQIQLEWVEYKTTERTMSNG